MLIKHKVNPDDPYVALESGTMLQTVSVGNKTRKFLTYIPETARSACAGLMILGKNGETAESLYKKSAWTKLAAEASPNFILFFLEPEKGVWNIDESYQAQDGDVAYVEAVFSVASENKHFCIHETKMYLFGNEEGGTIAHMAAMNHTVLYAGIATIGAPDVKKEYCQQCGNDHCMDLFGFDDTNLNINKNKNDIPLPAWVIDYEKNAAGCILQYWLNANKADYLSENGSDDTDRYIREHQSEFPYDQETAAYEVWNTTVPYVEGGCDYELLHKIWEEFLVMHQRWLSEPGGSLRKRLKFEGNLEIKSYKRKIGGWMREWYVYVPEELKACAGEKFPLVFAYHGYTCSGEIYAGNTGWCQIAKEKKFMVAFPSAIPGRLDMESEYTSKENMDLPAWNILHDIPNGPDEFEYFREMFQEICADWPVDTTRVFATGHSHGSMMVQALALAMPEYFAAVAPCSGVVFEGLYNEFCALPELKGAASVPIWMFVGDREGSLIDAHPTETNATGKTIILWHSINHLKGRASERFDQHYRKYAGRWYDLVYLDAVGNPSVMFTRVDDFPHGTMPSMSRRIWDEFFVHYSRKQGKISFQ